MKRSLRGRVGVLLLAACGGGDAPRPEVGTPVSPAAPEPPSPALVAESAAAAAGVRRHTDSVTRAARDAAGVPQVEARGDPTEVLTPAAEYAACIEQAAQARPPTRARLEHACANRRRAREGN